MNKLLLILYLLPMSAYAGWFGNKLSSYTCPTDSDALACSSRCTKDKNPSYEYQFSTDIKRNLVLITYFEDGKQTGSSILDYCKIFDDKNWNCDKSNVYAVTTIQSQSMAQGVYSYISHDYRTKDNKEISAGLACAK